MKIAHVCWKQKKTCNPTIRSSSYIVVLIFLIEVVALAATKFVAQLYPYSYKLSTRNF